MEIRRVLEYSKSIHNNNNNNGKISTPLIDGVTVCV